LRDENARLCKLVADLSLDKEALQSVIEKTVGAHSDEGLCRADSSQVCLHRMPRMSLAFGSGFKFSLSSRKNDDGLREYLIALAREKPRYGYRCLRVLLERESKPINHKRVHRIYREAGLVLRRKKRKHCVRTSALLGVDTEANQERVLDFVHDVTASGRSIRVLNVIDAYTRESLVMEVDTSFAGLRLMRALDEIMRNAVCRRRFVATMGWS
jgi:transposase InsO family protein